MIWYWLLGPVVLIFISGCTVVLDDDERSAEMPVPSAQTLEQPEPDSVSGKSVVTVAVMPRTHDTPHTEFSCVFLTCPRDSEAAIGRPLFREKEHHIEHETAWDWAERRLTWQTAELPGFTFGAIHSRPGGFRVGLAYEWPEQALAEVAVKPDLDEITALAQVTVRW